MEIKDEKLSRDKWETCKAACDRLSCKISQNQGLLYWFTELCHRSIAKEYSVMFSRNKKNYCLQNITPPLLQPFSSIVTTGVTADHVRPSKFPIYRAINLNFIGIQLPFPRKS